MMPESVSAERVQLLEGFGAEIIFSAAEKGTNESINVAKEMAHENPSWFMPYQYGNRANPDAHYTSTGPEIVRDVPEVDMFVAGLGTGGTLMGVGRALREHRAEVKIVAAAPHPDDKVQGLRSIEHGFIPPVLDLDALDARIMVEAEESFFWTKKLLTDAGVFVGVSSGAVLASSIRAAKRLEGGTIVMLFADGGWKYLSTGIYTRDWSGYPERSGGADMVVTAVPADATELCFATASDIARWIRDGEISARDVMSAHLAQIERVNAKVNAIVTLLDGDELLDRASASDDVRTNEGPDALGPLHGLPVGIKDLQPTAGIRTTYGSRIFQDFVPSEDSLTVQRYKAAGAIVIGKTNSPEFGAGSQTFNEVIWDHAQSVCLIEDLWR